MAGVKGKRRLSKAQREHALDLVARGVAQADIAIEIGCSQPTISRLVAINRHQQARGQSSDTVVAKKDIPLRSALPAEMLEEDLDWLA